MSDIKRATAALEEARRERERLEHRVAEADAAVRALEAKEPDPDAIKARRRLAQCEAAHRSAQRDLLQAESETKRAEISEARATVRAAMREREAAERKLTPAKTLARLRETERRAEAKLGAALAERERVLTARRTKAAAAARTVREEAEAQAAAARLRRAGWPDPRLRQAQARHAQVVEEHAKARANEASKERFVARARLAQDRAAALQATKQRRGLETGVAVLASRLRAVERTRGENSDAYRAARNDLQKARQALARSRVAERDALNQVATRAPGAVHADPDVELGDLDPLCPLVLFPVRIETRFAIGRNGGVELRVRVYPDEIFARAHDPRLTRAEATAGLAYWETAWTAQDEQAAWSTLAQLYPSERAAWIVKTMTPTNLASGDPQPAFPVAYADPATLPENYAQRVDAPLLPDRWLAVCYRGGQEVTRAVSRVVLEPLTLTVHGSVPDSDLIDISGDGLTVDRDVLWTIDFDRAEQAGMAVRVTPLTATDLSQGFDRVLVVGVKTSLNEGDTGERLAELFDEHRYARGLALVRQGTPTNNTATANAEFPPDEDARVTFARERNGAALNDASDGLRLLRAMGLPEARIADLAPHLAGAYRTEGVNARAMIEALWPATWGYMLENLMTPAFSPEMVARVKQFASAHVRGRGPLPAFRIGATPYGVLPVSSLARWPIPEKDGDASDIFAYVLRELREIWLTKAAAVPRVGRTPGDPDKDLVDMLSVDASAREVRVRPALGVNFYRNLFGLLGLSDADWNSWASRGWWQGRAILESLGRPDWDVRLLSVVFDEQAHRFNGSLVAPDPLSETQPLQPNYINWLADTNTSVDDLRDHRMPGGAPNALLYLMLRHAALLTYANAAFDLEKRLGGLKAVPAEQEFVGIVAGEGGTRTFIQQLDARIAQVSVEPLKVYVRTDAARVKIPDLAEYQRALAALAPLPTAELERLFTETLDTCSHRIDAWITGLASARLEELRNARREGAYLGGYAWVENLKPIAPAKKTSHTLPNGKAVALQTDNGGYVHAPSLTHAAAAAVLRNAYLTRATSTAAPAAIDLSSARVRGALGILDAIRAGQSLPAIFGYLIERALDDRNLQIYKEPLRLLYPMPGLVTPPPATPADTIAARDVVNGWALYQAPQPLAGLKIAAADAPQLDAVVAELREVADAVADLLTAESVYQIVSGGVGTASSSLDTLSKGARPAEPAIAHTPRGGTKATYRMAVTFDASATAAVAGWSATQRANVEPALNAWVARLLGDPATVRCRATYSSPQPGDPERREAVEIRLSQLGLAPLDVLALAQGAEQSAAASELDLRIAYVVLAAASPGADVQIVYEIDPTWDRTVVRTFPELLELARAINQMLRKSRPLRPEDLLLPESISAVQAADRKVADATTRADAARDALGVARAHLVTACDDVLSGAAADLDTLRGRLLETAQFGIGGAVPRSRTGTEAALGQQLIAQATSALHEIDTRLTSEAGEADATRRVGAIFGKTVFFIPQFNVVQAAELDQSIGAAGAVASNALEPVKWLQRVARIRAGAWHWRRLGLYASSLGTPLPAAEIVQLPYTAGARWVALPFQSDVDRPPSGRVAISLYRSQAIATNVPWAGLLLDDWTATIPNAKELTGVAFHYDDPGAEAPQAVLLAVPPPNTRAWDVSLLLATLNETFDLARIRAIEPEQLSGVGQFLPAIFLAANREQETVATDFSRARIGDPTIRTVRAST
jgi:hypothetical protein